MPASLVGVNTLLPNRLVSASVSSGRIVPLRGYSKIEREVDVGKHSRIDLKLSGGDLPRCFVEVKNCTWVQEGVARFPDAVTERGRKHMEVLQELVGKGYRAAVFFLIQRMDAQVFSPARELDPAYTDALQQAVKAGVEIMVYDVELTLEDIQIHRSISVEL